NHASFDGSNKIYYPTLARAPTTEMTLSFWLRTTTTTETVLVSFVRTDEDSSGLQFVLKILANGILSYTEKIGDVYATKAMSNSNWFNNGKWVHVALVKKGDTFKIHVNGIWLNSGPNVNMPSPTYANAGFSVGADVDDSQGLVGEMSNLVIYLRAFADHDVTKLFWNTAKLSCHVNTSPVCDYDWCCETFLHNYIPYITYFDSKWEYSCTSCPDFTSDNIDNMPEQCQP
ncbi:MAG: LamG domain-containing protein, partial [Proteobacteria bacterium]